MTAVDDLKKQILENKRAIDLIDESQYSLNEWCEALVEFSRWEEREKCTLTLQEKMDYLSCCAEGAGGAGKLVSLVTLLENFLKEHGVAGGTRQSPY